MKGCMYMYDVEATRQLEHLFVKTACANSSYSTRKEFRSNHVEYGRSLASY